MSAGPVQLIALGFTEPGFRDGIVAELEALHHDDRVRVIDALAVSKNARGTVEVEHLGDLTPEEAAELGSMICALIGLGSGGGEGAVADADLALFDDVDAWDVLEDIPAGSSAALILLEHHWAVPLRDAVLRAGGFRISDGIISPLDLVGFGLHTAAEAARLNTMETTESPLDGQPVNIPNRPLLTRNVARRPPTV